MLTIKIDTNNDAFKNGNLELELELCLNSVIQKINGWDIIQGNLFDSNGNDVGSFKLTDK